MLPPLAGRDTGVPATEWARRCTIPGTAGAEVALDVTTALHEDGAGVPGEAVADADADAVAEIVDDDEDGDDDGKADAGFALPPS